MASITRENTGLLVDKLTLTLAKDDYFPAYDKALKSYTKKANLPGFRPGMVPTSLIKRQYGASIFMDEVLKAVEANMNDYLKKENISFFGQPLPSLNNTDMLKRMDQNDPKDYDFGFDIGLRPKIDDLKLSGAKIEKMKVDITDALLDDEIKRMQTSAATLTEQDVITTATNVLDLVYTQGDNAKELSNVVNMFAEDTQAKLIGLKKDETIEININEAFKESEVEGIKKSLNITEDADANFTVTIIKVSDKVDSEINKEFFDKVFPGKNIENEADFRLELTKEMETYWGGQAVNQMNDNIYHHLIDNLDIQFPEEFLKRLIKSGGEKEKTDEEVEQEFPKFMTSLKWSMISEKIIEEEKLDVTEAEVRENVKQQMMGYMGVKEITEDMAWLNTYVDNMLKDKKQLERTYNNLLAEKLFAWAGTQVTPVEKLVSMDEFLKGQHHHSH